MLCLTLDVFIRYLAEMENKPCGVRKHLQLVQHFICIKRQVAFLCLRQQYVAEALCFRVCRPAVRTSDVHLLTPFSDDPISPYLVEGFP